MLIAFTGYLTSSQFDPGSPSHTSFPQWMKQRPELRRWAQWASGLLWACPKISCVSAQRSLVCLPKDLLCVCPKISCVPAQRSLVCLPKDLLCACPKISCVPAPRSPVCLLKDLLWVCPKISCVCPKISCVCLPSLRSPLCLPKDLLYLLLPNGLRQGPRACCSVDATLWIKQQACPASHTQAPLRLCRCSHAAAACPPFLAIHCQHAVLQALPALTHAQH